MGEYTLAGLILGFCIALAAFEIIMANRTREGGANEVDWKRARGIVWVGAVLAVLAWIAQYMMS